MINLEQYKSPEAEQQEKIAIIESLKTGIHGKADTALVLLNEKPATDLSIYTDAIEEQSTEAEKIKATGLFFRKINELNNEDGQRWDYFIAKEEKDLNDLLTADASSDHEKFGRLMGFPESAIKGFIEDKRLDMNKEITIREQDPELVYGNFRLSEDNYQSELATIKRWSEALKKSAPNIYKELKEMNG